MMNPIWDPSDVIDPVVDRVWMVEVTMDSTMFVVAADEHEAKDLAGRHWRDEEIEPVSFYATETDKVYGEEARLIAWGRSFYKGKQLYIGDVLALIERKRCGIARAGIMVSPKRAQCIAAIIVGVAIVGFQDERAVATLQGLGEFFEPHQRDTAIVQRLGAIRGELQRRVISR